ncbi:uncharacterized protein EI97DRAFT_435316 [Westerdykella ornata]|uniref:Mediator of RNA polymerase II transcription subunit 6 n=1 Tax=Westerdykella ornata TaxID=318751 RepID=A0A6A6JDG1_WESOR|nr:uncharacterized protein EI97DRAFT_435316 [Westerdykella ornata]KAF2274213.1 hypothetical protein EI97DRAFT_435316 [Westerdykella ornata]
MKLAELKSHDDQELNEPWRALQFGGTPEPNSNSILWYFAWSPFWDPSCNNKALENQAQQLPNGQAILNSRQEFEATLRAQYPTGVQFVVSSEAQDRTHPWVIQRQNRFFEDKEIKTEVEGIYYTRGAVLQAAPKLMDVVDNQLFSISRLMDEFLETSSALDHWSPSTGHTYLPPSYKSKTDGGLAQISSRAGSVVPGGDTDASQPAAASAQQSQMTEFSDAFFLQSLNLTNRYRNEYMDENPLQGEPGAFVFASTNKQVEARNKAQAAAAAQTSAATGTTAVSAGKPVEGGSAGNSAAPTPKAAPNEATSRKGSTVGMPPKVKGRRKSKGGASPVTPTAPGGF